MKIKLDWLDENQRKAILAVLRERNKQDEKWGEQNHDSGKWLAILIEEIGELAQEMLEENPLNATAELTQVVAVALAWLECRNRLAFPQSTTKKP